jgi:hypothetical protein
MSLAKVGDTITLQVKSATFVWEPAWDCFRPVTSVAWTGERILIDDRAYCADPTDPDYGYGSPAMRELCTLLTKRYAPSSAPSTSLPPLGPSPEWFYDRFLCLTPCAPRDKASWKRFHKGRYRSPRSAPKTRLTRRARS